MDSSDYKSTVSRVSLGLGFILLLVLLYFIYVGDNTKAWYTGLALAGTCITWFVTGQEEIKYGGFHEDEFEEIETVTEGGAIQKKKLKKKNKKLKD